MARLFPVLTDRQKRAIHVIIFFAIWFGLTAFMCYRDLARGVEWYVTTCEAAGGEATCPILDSISCTCSVPFEGPRTGVPMPTVPKED